MSARAAVDPEYVVEGFLNGDLLGGSVYLLRGQYLLDREDLLEGTACGASARRHALLLSFISPLACPGNGSVEVVDASSIREEGLKVVASRLMDELSSGGVVLVDSAELMLSAVGDEREYMNLLYTLRRISRMGQGTLVIASAEGPEEVVADYVMEVGPDVVGSRRFRVVRVSSPYSPSSRDRFLLSSDRRILKPASDVERGALDLGELDSVISSLRPGSSLEVYVDGGVPEHLVEGLLEGIASALKGAGVRASIYPGGSKEVGEDGGLLVLGRSEESIGIQIHLGCPTCPRGRSDYLVRMASVGGVVVVFFERPWSAAYYADGLSLRRFE